MSILKVLFGDRKEAALQRNERCDELIQKMSSACFEFEAIFKAHAGGYIEPEVGRDWRRKHAELISDVQAVDSTRSFRKASHYEIFRMWKGDFLRNYREYKDKISEHNDMVATASVRQAYSLIGDVEGRKLDSQQMLCIVKKAHNHLVIAGAGTGKTTTVVGKIKYLLKSGQFGPEDILVLSFTNASAMEMCERIHKETGEQIAASTFHKLGLNIIRDVEGIMPKISQLKMRAFIKEQLQRNMKNAAYLNLLVMYFSKFQVLSRSEFEFEDEDEYDEYLTLNPPVTLLKERMKSYGEMDVANFLTQNGVRYIYEQPYEIDTRTAEYSEYRPDFYLPDYGIYIEYFGIDRDGEVAPYFRGRDGMSATETYQASMQWKRETHIANNTVMIECYAYEHMDGCLEDRLKEKLTAQGVALKPKSPSELWEQLASSDDDSSILDGLYELFQTLISLIKSNDYTIAQVRGMSSGDRQTIRANDILLSLLEPIYTAYCDYLVRNNEIDFNDMINKAAAYVREGKYVNRYRYVIVDEYQDISRARFSLLKALRDSVDYGLFCVGDDWQSIYRFAGSDIGYILNFDHYWGGTEISKIETTYRFSQQLVDISTHFVMKNPAQIRKAICGKAEQKGFALGEVNGYTETYAMDFMVKRLNDLPKNSSVFFIGRYTFDAKLLNGHELRCQYNNVSGFVDVKYARRPDLKMAFITAHKSKGLQADYVFIINNKGGRMGFPSQVQEAPILTLLLDNCDDYPHSEERRLFYVAMTRSKVKTFLVTIANKESVFAQELKERFGEEMKREQYECPLCGGRLSIKKGPYGEFFGCSNYRTTGCNYKRKITRQSKQ